MRSMDVDQWKYLVSRISNPTTAKIIVEYLDSDPTAKLQFAGIYVRARETVQRSRIRYAKAKQWGERLARLMSWISSSATKLRQRQSVAVDLNTLRKETPNQQPLIWPVLNVNI
jgi:hypothetical protein